jgi:hypothetical protein
MMIEDRIQHMAQQFPSPPTPVIVIERRPVPRAVYLGRVLAVAAAIALVVMVTPLRAAVLEWLQIGAVTIFIGPTPEPTRLPSLVNLFGETTLAEAQAAARFPLQIPRALGLPDHVFRQDDEFNTVIMVWDDPAISFFQIGPEGQHYMKHVFMAEDVTVNGSQGAWIELPHTLQYEQDGDLTTQEGYLVEGHVLIWHAAGITYRLETGMEQADAIAIAESLGTPVE